MSENAAPLERKLLLGFAAVLAALLLLVVSGWRASLREDAASLMLWRTLELHNLLADVGTQSHLVELNSQNFRLTGNPLFLEERDQAIVVRAAGLEEVGAQVTDDPPLREDFARLQAVVAERVAIHREVERRFQAGGLAAAESYAIDAPLVETRRRLLAILDEMDWEVVSRLDRRSAELREAREQQRLIDLLTLLLALAIAIHVFLTLRRQLRAGEALKLKLLASEERVRAQNVELERRVSERTAALAASEQRFRLLVDGVRDYAITLLDPEGRVMSWNAGAERLKGYSYDEIVGQSMARFYPPVDQLAGKPEQFCARAAKEGWAEDENWRVRKDGSLFFANVVLTALHDEDGALLGFAKVTRDLTERKAAEDRILAINAGLERTVAERTAAAEAAQHIAEEASRAKSAFLAAMSHEIRTPMNGVIGMVDVLQQTSLKGYQVEMVDIIRESAFALLTIIDDILDFSKIEAGRLEIDWAPTDAGSVVEKACQMLDSIASRKGVELTLFADPALPRVMCDAARLRQIVVNLTGNAVKFSSASERAGKVAVRLELRARDAARATIELKVIDNGIGMDADTQAKLFKAFTQADASTTRRFGGTGLGLAIVKKLVGLMGGTIAVDSAPGKGTTFSVHLSLPLVPEAAEATETTEAAEPALAGLDCVVVGNTLLADDWACYARAAGARVTRVPSLAAAGALPPAAIPESRLWVADCADREGDRTICADLRDMAVQSDMGGLRFLLVEQGRRRRLRQLSADPPIHVIDANLLSRRNCLAALAIAAGRAQLPAEADAHGKGAAALQPPARDAALLQGRLILVAEDNETNQKVITRQLALLGHAADVAGDGLETLERLRGGDYALVLTDLHMPRMDGYELTLAQRGRERVQGGRRVPIVALTANALKGEAQRCLAAGMDDYLSKPVALDDLQAMLDKWLAPQATAPAAPAVAVPDSPGGPAVAVPPAPIFAAPPVFDVGVLTALVGADAAIVDDLLKDFRRGAREIVAAAGQAGTDWPQVGQLAHKLKSSARAVGALALGELCARLEAAAKTGDAAAAEPLRAALEAAFAQATQAIAAYLQGE